MGLPMTERRYVRAELRADSQGDELSLVGYASVFNSQSEDLGGFRETVMPGAFARSLREGSDVKCLMNHDPSLVLGRVKNGTLRMEEDAHGLKFRCMLPNTSTGRDLYTLVKRGDIDSCSFAFIPKDQSWEDVRSASGEMSVSRKLMDVDLLDVSAVTNPAYLSTSLSARSLFPDGEPVEMRSAINDLVAKREIPVVPVVEKRGSEAQPPEPYAINLPQPFDSDMKQAWWDAFLVAYLEAIHVLKQKHQEAIATGIAVANLAWQPETEVTPEVPGQGNNPTPIKGDIVSTDMDRAAEIEAEERKKKAEEERKLKCLCDCPECQDGDCLDCSNDDCNDENCDANFEGDEADGERTKKVGDAVLRSSMFAWVGDPKVTKTWKLPLDTVAHVTSSVNRFIEVKGIPADQKETVWKAIVSAAKTFEVPVIEEDSLRAAISHEITLAVLNKVEYDQGAAELEAYVRMLAIQTELQ